MIIKPLTDKKIIYADSDEPLEIVFTEDKIKDIHKYEITTPGHYFGKKGGVTAVTGFKDKSNQLMPWAVNMGLEKVRDNYTYYDEKSGDVFYELTEADLEIIRVAHYKKKEKAGDIGTRVHHWIEHHLRGKDLPIEDDMQPSVQGFLKWEKQSGIETMFSERTVYSKHFDYAGRLDWGGNKDGRYGLIDWKTGNCDEEYKPYAPPGYIKKLRAKTDNIIQNAGYDVAISEEDGIKAEFFGVLYIPVTGKVEYFESNETEIAREAFITTLLAKRNWEALIETNKYREPTK